MRCFKCVDLPLHETQQNEWVITEFDNFFEFADHVMSHDKHELKHWAEDVLDSDNYINYRLENIW